MKEFKQISLINAGILRILKHFKNSKNLFDVYWLFIHIITFSIGLRFNLKKLINYNKKLSGKYAKNKLKEFEKGDKYDFNGILFPKFDLITYNDYYSLYELYMYVMETLFIYIKMIIIHQN